MGYLHYGAGDGPIEVPDRMLTHVKIVIATKLRRNESFLISWRHASDASAGRSSIWVHPSIPLRFTFDSAEAEDIDPAILQELAADANSTKGLWLELDSEATRARLEPVQLVA